MLWGRNARDFEGFDYRVLRVVCRYAGTFKSAKKIGLLFETSYANWKNIRRSLRKLRIYGLIERDNRGDYDVNLTGLILNARAGGTFINYDKNHCRSCGSLVDARACIEELVAARKRLSTLLKVNFT